MSSIIKTENEQHIKREPETSIIRGWPGTVPVIERPSHKLPGLVNRYL